MPITSTTRMSGIQSHSPCDAGQSVHLYAAKALARALLMRVPFIFEGV